MPSKVTGAVGKPGAIVLYGTEGQPEVAIVGDGKVKVRHFVGNLTLEFLSKNGVSDPYDPRNPKRSVTNNRTVVPSHVLNIAKYDAAGGITPGLLTFNIRDPRGVKIKRYRMEDGEFAPDQVCISISPGTMLYSLDGQHRKAAYVHNMLEEVRRSGGDSVLCHLYLLPPILEKRVFSVMQMGRPCPPGLTDVINAMTFIENPEARQVYRSGKVPGMSFKEAQKVAKDGESGAIVIEVMCDESHPLSNLILPPNEAVRKGPGLVKPIGFHSAVRAMKDSRLIEIPGFSNGRDGSIRTAAEIHRNFWIAVRSVWPEPWEDVASTASKSSLVYGTFNSAALIAMSSILGDVLLALDDCCTSYRSLSTEFFVDLLSRICTRLDLSQYSAAKRRPISPSPNRIEFWERANPTIKMMGGSASFAIVVDQVEANLADAVIGDAAKGMDPSSAFRQSVRTVFAENFPRMAGRVNA